MIERASLGEQIGIAMREEIIEGRLPAGERLSIEDLAAKWQTSSTPVRDAAKWLASLGFLVIKPRSGLFVAEPNAQEFTDVFEVRIALECAAVRKAVDRIPGEALARLADLHRQAQTQVSETGDYALFLEHDESLHELITANADNARLQRIMAEMNGLIRWTRNLVLGHRRHAVEQALHEHLRILEALEARDGEAAEACLRAHLTRTMEETVTAMGEDDRDDPKDGKPSD